MATGTYVFRMKNSHSPTDGRRSQYFGEIPSGKRHFGARHSGDRHPRFTWGQTFWGQSPAIFRRRAGAPPLGDIVEVPINFSGQTPTFCLVEVPVNFWGRTPTVCATRDTHVSAAAIRLGTDTCGLVKAAPLCYGCPAHETNSSILSNP